MIMVVVVGPTAAVGRRREGTRKREERDEGKRKRETISRVWGPHCHMSFFYVGVGSGMPHMVVHVSLL
jgi:hypothetical protein